MMRLKKIIFMTLLLMASPIYSEEPSVFFIQPSNGDTVDSTFEVIFGIKEMSLAPAGTYEDNTWAPSSNHRCATSQSCDACSSHQALSSFWKSARSSDNHTRAWQAYTADDSW